MTTGQNHKALILENPILKILSELVAESHLEAWIIGGFVRDFLLKRPCKDIDVVCLGSGIELAKAFAKNVKGRSEIHIFKNFGTAMVKLDDWEVEFVGARKESYHENSRKPAVENGTLEDDQNRRDFTINALAISLMPKNLGDLIDPFNGLLHLEQKMLQTPLAPAATFSDDPLRMMRAIRFAAQLDFDIEADTFQGIIDTKDRLSIISAERITDELNKIIACKKPSYGFKLLYHTGLLKIFFPEMVDLAGAANTEGFTHKDNFFHTLEVLDNVASVSDNLWLRWAAILHDIGKPATKRFSKKDGWTFHGHEDKGARMVPGIFRKLRLPMNEKMRYVQKLVRLHLRPIALVNEVVTDSAIRRILFETGADMEDLMLLCRADVTTKNPNKAKRYLANFDKVDLKLIEVEEKDKVRNFQPVFTGEMVMTVLNLPPGPMVGVFKTQLREAALEGDIQNTLEDGFSFLTKLAAEKQMQPTANAWEKVLELASKQETKAEESPEQPNLA